ncbi:MAG: DUF4920 domain-containing protein [Crocinitomicaceae bacterium]
MKKKIFMLLLPLSTLLIACGGENTGEESSDTDTTTVIETNEDATTELAFDGVEKGDYILYGHSEIDPKDAFSVTEMYAEYQSTGEFNDKVMIKIEQVCQKAGCWITFKDAKDEEVRVFFRDHFTIPIETASGTEAILYGALISDTLSVDFQKHLLDDAKEAGEEVDQKEYDAITEDKIELSFDAEAILVKK